MPPLQGDGVAKSRPPSPATASNEETVARARRYRPWRFFLLAIVPFAALVAAQWKVPPAATAGDYAQYLLHAQALADGRPYGDIGYIVTPLNPLIGPAAQPPVWPMILAPIVSAFGVQGDGPRIVSLLIMFAFLATVFRYFVRREELVVGVAITAMLGIGMERSYLLAAPLSDPLFLLITWLTLSAADADRVWTWPRIALIVSLAVLAAGTRVSGVALLPAIVLASLFRSPAERRRILIVAVAGGIALTAALLVAGDYIPFWRQLLRPPEVLLHRVQRQVFSYRFAFFESLLYPSSVNLVNDVYHISAAGVALMGAGRMIRGYAKTAVGAFAVCYVALLLISPVMDTRYTWPLWPLILCASALGLLRVLSFLRLPRRALSPIVGLLALAIAAFSALGAAGRARPTSLLDHPAAVELFAWVEAAPSKGSMRVLFFNPRVFTLQTGVPAMGPFIADEIRTQRELERLRINTVIFGSLGLKMPSQQRLFESTAWLRRSWPLAFENNEFMVYLRPDSIPSAQPPVTTKGQGS